MTFSIASKARRSTRFSRLGAHSFAAGGKILATINTLSQSCTRRSSGIIAAFKSRGTPAGRQLRRRLQSAHLVVAPAGVLLGHLDDQLFHFRTGPWPTRYDRCLEPSNFCATSFRNHARMVSGVATRAIFSKPFRPSLLQSRRASTAPHWKDAVELAWRMCPQDPVLGADIRCAAGVPD